MREYPVMIIDLLIKCAIVASLPASEVPAWEGNSGLCGLAVVCSACEQTKRRG